MRLNDPPKSLLMALESVSREPLLAIRAMLLVQKGFEPLDLTAARSATKLSCN